MTTLIFDPAKRYQDGIDDLLVNPLVEGSLDIFSTFDPEEAGDPPYFVYNDAWWAKDIMDMSGVSWYGDGLAHPGSATRNGTLISHRHVLMAWHHPCTGDNITFVAQDGTNDTFTVNVEAWSGPAKIGADLAVGYLAEAVPAKYTCYQTLPADYTDYFDFDALYNEDPNNTESYPLMQGKQHPTAGTGTQQWMIDDLRTVDWVVDDTVALSRGGRPGRTATRELYFHEADDGDSACPLFLLLEGTPILMGCRHGANNWPLLPDLITEVNAAMTALHGDDTYQLTTLNVVPLNGPPPPFADRRAKRGGMQNLGM